MNQHDAKATEPECIHCGHEPEPDNPGDRRLDSWNVHQRRGMRLASGVFVRQFELHVQPHGWGMNQHALRHNFTEWVWRKSQGDGQAPLGGRTGRGRATRDTARRLQRIVPGYPHGHLARSALSERQEATVKDSNKERI